MKMWFSFPFRLLFLFPGFPALETKNTGRRAKIFLCKWRSCKEDAFGLSESYMVHSLWKQRPERVWRVVSLSISHALPFQTDTFLLTLRTDGNQTRGRGSLPCTPWGLCIQFSKTSPRSKEKNEAIDCSQLCRTCLAFTILTDLFFADIEW